MIFEHNGKFYLVDWKSNHLGSTFESYNEESLKKAMHAHFYTLQYHLYTLALHQYLRLRVSDYRYETDFGGVTYMFIRGIDPDQSQEFGIYKDIPDPRLIHLLGTTLIPGYEHYPK